MSYYDHNDPSRNEGGQFYNHLNANVGEQWLAGVNQYDSYQTAHLKTENHRRALGLDPYTGLAPPSSGAGLPYTASASGPADESQWGAVFWGLCKAVVLWPAVIAITIVVLAIGATFIGMQFDAPTLASRAAHADFADYEAPPVVMSSGKASLGPVKPEELLAAFRAFKPDSTADPRMSRAHVLMADAYRCLFQTGCREVVARLDAVAGDNLPRTAAGVFQDAVRSGSETATRDMCLFAIKAGSSYRDLIAARRSCVEANALNRHSTAGPQALARIDASWAMRRARMYDLATDLRWRLEHGAL